MLPEPPPAIRYISCLISASSHRTSAAITLAAMHSSRRNAQPPSKKETPWRPRNMSL